MTYSPKNPYHHHPQQGPYLFVGHGKHSKIKVNTCLYVQKLPIIQNP